MSGQGLQEELVSDKFIDHVMAMFEPRLLKTVGKIKNQINRDFELLEQEVDKIAEQQVVASRQAIDKAAKQLYSTRVSSRCGLMLRRIKEVYEEGLAQMKRHIEQRESQLCERTKEYYEGAVQNLRGIIQEKVRTGQKEVNSEENLREYVDSFLLKARNLAQIKELIEKVDDTPASRLLVVQAIRRIHRCLEEYRKVEDLTLEEQGFLNELAKAFEIDTDTDARRLLKSGRDCYLSR